MTPREVMLNAMELKPTERLPTCVFGGGIWTYIDAGEGFDVLREEPEKLAEVQIKAASRIDSDIVYVGSGYNNCLAGALGSPLKWSKENPPQSQAPIINSMEDINRLRGELDRIYEDPVMNTILKAYDLVKREIGDKYLVAITSWGPFILAGQMAGYENLLKACFKNKALVHAAVGFGLEVLQKFFGPLLEKGLELHSTADSLGSMSAISRKGFEEFVHPYTKKWNEFVKGYGSKELLHMCGPMNDRLDLQGDIGAHLVSLDENTDRKDAKMKFGGKTNFGGNVSPTKIIDWGTKEDVVRETRRCIEECAPGGAYVSMPGCDLTPATKLENIQAFIQTSKQYPIDKLPSA